MSNQSPEDIYIQLMSECFQRLAAADDFLQQSNSRRYVPLLEAAILQVRKSLELIAVAAIAPDKDRYQAFRATATKDPDFTKDYHAAKIFAALARINPDFFPRPLVRGVLRSEGSDGILHLDDRKTGFLGKNQFQRAYDRLGRYLHAHNPWGASRQLEQIAADLPKIVTGARGLIALHGRIIRTDTFKGVWIVEADSPTPKLISAEAKGDFVVTKG
jgi:hypothetical protein